MTEDQKSALKYLAQALSEYANTMPPSVKGPFVAEVNRAIQTIDPQPQAAP